MATPNHQQYPYLPLNPSTHEIRLLTFTYPPSANSPTHTPPPADPNNPKQPPYTLTLTHTSLTTIPRPPFSALSYVWGSPSDPLPLQIGSHTVPVTQNLHSAITRLARQRWTGQIWIDALCINQADTGERNWQVAMMGRIYRLAEEVLVWLGPEEDDGALRTVRQLGVLFREQVTGMEGGLGLRDAVLVEGFVKTVLQFSVTSTHVGERVVAGEGGRLMGFDFEAIWRLFRGRPWWRRVWIIQEVVLARRAVLFCGADPEAGGELVSWEDVSECIRLFEWMVLYPSTAPEYQKVYALLGDIYPNVSHLKLASDGYRASLKNAKGGCASDDGGMTLLDTILQTSYGTSADGAIQATDPRDRIYGLLGMVREEDRRRIPVDYSPDMTVTKVLFAVAKALLQDHGPDILSFCQRPSLPQANDLPSWVPDWTAPRSNPTISGAFFGSDSDIDLRGNASKGAGWRDWAPKCRVADVTCQDPVVSLMGAVVGRIGRVGNEFKAAPGSPKYLDDCREWLLELARMVREGPGNGELEGETWRVPMADIGLGNRADVEGPRRFIHGFEVLTGKLQPPPEGGANHTSQDWMTSESWDYRRVWKLLKRRAFVDDAGRPGLGPNHTAPGDHIVVLAGGHVPFILREQVDSNTTSSAGAPSRYRVLGPAYVYGLMDGEGITGTISLSEIMIA